VTFVGVDYKAVLMPAVVVHVQLIPGCVQALILEIRRCCRREVMSPSLDVPSKTIRRTAG